MHRFRSVLSVAVPDGWLARESIELVSTDERVYVAASVSALPPDMTLDQYAEDHSRQIGELYPEYEETGLDRVTLPSGRETIFRNLRWQPPEGDRLGEVQMYAIEDGRGILARACTPVDSFAQHEARLREVLSGITLGSASMSGGLVRRDDTPRSRTYDAFEAGRLSTTPASAFGLADAASNGKGDAESRDVAGAWKGARAEWQKAGERL
jgi:hypothetical protein